MSKSVKSQFIQIFQVSILILHRVKAADQEFTVDKACDYPTGLTPFKCTKEDFEDSVCTFNDGSYQKCICHITIFMNIKMAECVFEAYDLDEEGDPFIVMPVSDDTATNGTLITTTVRAGPCGIITPPKNGNVQCNNAITECIVSCNMGYIPSSIGQMEQHQKSLNRTTENKTIRCEDNNLWDRNFTDTCVPTRNACGYDSAEFPLDELQKSVQKFYPIKRFSSQIGGTILILKCRNATHYFLTGTNVVRAKCQCNNIGNTYSCWRTHSVDEIGRCSEDNANMSNSTSVGHNTLISKLRGTTDDDVLNGISREVGKQMLEMFVDFMVEKKVGSNSTSEIQNSL